MDLGINEGDTIYISVRAYNGAGLYSGVVTSGPVAVDYEPLGEASNQLSVGFAGGWSQAELADLQWFLARMLPVIKEIYGPPSHSYRVTLVNDPYYSSTAVFFSGPNEIHMDGLYPQLLTHELIHAFRDNVVAASNDHWHYDPTLSGFEESFAQGVSFMCMNRYAELYPTDPVVPGGVVYLSDYDWDYDFLNTGIITTTDYWSDGGGSGIYWLRYEMGAAAVIKASKDNPTFARDFNAEYYSRLNADHALTTSRVLMRDIVAAVVPIIEGRPAAEWVDRQRIFDCVVKSGRKIWLRTQHYPNWSEYMIFQRIFYYETYSNGSEWAYWDGGIGDWVYYGLNGSVGHAVLRNWAGTIVAEKDLLIEPVDNPPVYYGFGSETVNLSTDDDTSPWPGDDPADYMLGIHDFGMYRMEVVFGSDTTEVVRIMGDSLRSTSGIFGAVLNDGAPASGVLYIDHEDFPPEPSISVVNGAFHAERSWASVLDPSTGITNSKPGRLFVKYIDQNGKEYTGRRNIDRGSWSGNQMLLFETRDMTPVDNTAVTLASFEAVRRGFYACVIWEVASRSGHMGFNLYREEPGHLRTRVNTDLIAGSTRYEFVDRSAPAGTASYWLQEVETGGATAWHGPVTLPPVPGSERVLDLFPNVPNPFNPVTAISYRLPDWGRAVLAVYDAAGACVTTLVDEDQRAGDHTVEWSGRNAKGMEVSSGVYFLRLTFGNQVRNRKIVLLK